MRNVARFVVVGLLVFACEDVTGPQFGPPPCSTPPDTVFDVFDGPLRLGQGGADNRAAIWALEDCHGFMTPLSTFC